MGVTASAAPTYPAAADLARSVGLLLGIKQTAAAARSAAAAKAVPAPRPVSAPYRIVAPVSGIFARLRNLFGGKR
jgi:hypothetical protein